jgi:arylsulfatase A-like enzyme
MNKKQYPNIIWFMIDSLRNEFLNEFGNKNAPRTFLDDFLHESVSFVNCYSAAPYTITSLAAKMTGCYPSVNKVDGWLKKNPLDTINQKCITIIDMLKYHNYTTTYISSSSSCAFIPPDSFDNYVCCNYSSEQFPVEIYQNSISPKFVIFIMDVIHDDCCFNPKKFDSTMYEKSVQKISSLIENYYNSIKSENDLVIITSDHGVRVIDELQDTIYTEEYVTGRYLTEKTIKCSFNIKWNNYFMPQKITSLARSVDIFPTLMNILNWDYPLLDGVSLLPLINKTGEPVINFAYTLTGWSEIDPKSPGVWSIIYKNYKLVVSKEYRGIYRRKLKMVLFDLDTDQNEMIDISSDNMEIVNFLYEELKTKLMNYRDIEELYQQSDFDFKSILDFKRKNKNMNSLKIANDIIINMWQKKVRKNFLRYFFLKKIKRLIKYYFTNNKRVYY